MCIYALFLFNTKLGNEIQQRYTNNSPSPSKTFNRMSRRVANSGMVIAIPTEKIN